MLSPLGQYLADYRQRTAEVRRARVAAFVSGVDWQVTLEHTGGTVMATALNAIPLAVGQLVYVSRISAAGAPNAGFVILGAVNNTLPPAPPITVTSTAETVTRIVPSSLTIARDGTVGEIKIYGVGLTTAPTYGSASIVNDSAPTITPTLITLHVKWTGSLYGGVAGSYSLVIAGRTTADYFSVPVSAAIPRALWFGAEWSPKVWRVDPVALTELAVHDLTGLVGNNSKVIIGGDDYVYVYQDTSLASINRATGALAAVASATLGGSTTQTASGAYGFGWVWLCGTSTSLLRVHPTTGAKTTLTPAETPNIERVLAVDASYVWASGGNYLFRVNPDLTYTAYNIYAPAGGSGICGSVDDGTFIWSNTGTKILKVQKSDGTLTAYSAAIIGPNARGLARTSDGSLYVGDSGIKRIDPATLTVSNSSVGMGFSPPPGTDESSVWFAERPSLTGQGRVVNPDCSLGAIITLTGTYGVNLYNAVYA